MLPYKPLACLALLPFLAGCAGSGAIRAAESGNLPELRRAITEELAAGELDDSDARDIAQAVLTTDVGSTSGSIGAERIGALSPCARQLGDALERRARVADEPGAASQMLLVESRLGDPEDARSRADAALALLKGRPPAASVGIAAAWKAVFARTLVGPDDGKARRARFVDGDQGVRLAAIRAAREVVDPDDGDPLIEAARLDPLPLARTAAIRAAGTVGGERVVLALKDLWPLTDDPAREAIADAWSTPASLDAGGRRELVWAAETQKGSPSIAAAFALVRTGGAGKTDAIGVLTRAIAVGPPKDRIFAIAVAPLTAAPVREAVVKAEDDPDEAVSLAALSRLVEASPEAGGLKIGSKERAKAIARLRKLADGVTTRALAAKTALGRAGIRDVIPMLDRDLRGRDERARESAALALVSLGELARASLGTAEADGRARVSVACSILGAPPAD